MLGSWFDEKYRDGLTTGKRYATFKRALELLTERDLVSPLIVETGCQREPDDWGAGSSTSLFLDYCRIQTERRGDLWTVDNNPEHLARCKKIVGDAPMLWLHEADSVEFLRASETLIDLLYLDSFDYPLGKLLDVYGGKTDLDKALRILNELGEEEILKRHGFIVAESQEHCLREIEAAEHLLSPGSIVLIDDVLPGGGKPRLARKWMEAKGWEHVATEYQTLWAVR